MINIFFNRKKKTWEEKYSELVEKYLYKTILLGEDKEERIVVEVRLITPEKYYFADETCIVAFLREKDTYPYGSHVRITEKQLRKSKIVKNPKYKMMWGKYDNE